MKINGDRSATFLLTSSVKFYRMSVNRLNSFIYKTSDKRRYYAFVLYRVYRESFVSLVTVN
jgi:hypothetical protein